MVGGLVLGSTTSSNADASPTRRRSTDPSETRTESLPQRTEPAAATTGYAEDTSATVCIPAYNEARTIGALLDQLRREIRAGTPLGTILVEASGSTDNTGEVVREIGRDWPGVRLLQRPERLGLAGAISEMLKEVRTSRVVRIDADMTLSPGGVGRLLACLEDPSVGIVGPRIVPTPSGRRVLDTVLRAMYGLHDSVCRISPKITNVQVFRRFEADFPHDVETEDIMLQALATESGLRAVYVREELAFTDPPHSIRAFVRQRIRVISSEEWYAQRTRREGPPTGKPRLIAPAMFDGLRSREIPVQGLLLFASLELASRIFVRVRSALVGHVDLTVWESVRRAT